MRLSTKEISCFCGIVVNDACLAFLYRMFVTLGTRLLTKCSGEYLNAIKAFSHDVTAAMSVSQNNKMAALLVC